MESLDPCSSPAFDMYLSAIFCMFGVPHSWNGRLESKVRTRWSASRKWSGGLALAPATIDYEKRLAWDYLAGLIGNTGVSPEMLRPGFPGLPGLYTLWSGLAASPFLPSRPATLQPNVARHFVNL